MTITPEPKSKTEPLDIRHKAADTLAGLRPIEPIYPYIAPDYRVPFLHVGTEKQLFLDNFMLDHLEGVSRVFPEPRRAAQPLLEVGDLPWELHYNPIPAGAVYDPDDGKFKLWYTQSLTADPFNVGQVLCYAESTDAIHWHKPLSDACLPYQSHTATNIVARDTAGVTVVLNHDRSDPQRKFLMLNCPYTQAKERGLRIMSTVAASPDGLRWTIISEDSPFRHQHEPRILWDESIQRWISYGQYSHHWNFLYRTRQIGRQESEDFIHWTPKEVVLSADWDPSLDPNLEFHEMSIHKEGGTYIGITGEFIGEPLWCVNDTSGSNWRDIAHVRLGLYTSRDGKRWLRVGGPGPWVDNGPPGSADYGYACYSAAATFYHGGQMIIPYLAGPHKQHWYVGTPPRRVVPDVDFERERAAWNTVRSLASGYAALRRSIGGLILREDGWAELKPTYEHGRVITKQFVFEGQTLRVNADCFGGYARVAIVDPYFQSYPGFAAEDCDAVVSRERDQVWHTVTWQGNADVSALWDKPCRLIIHLHQASLYAFEFR